MKGGPYREIWHFSARVRFPVIPPILVQKRLLNQESFLMEQRDLAFTIIIQTKLKFCKHHINSRQISN